MNENFCEMCSINKIKNTFLKYTMNKKTKTVDWELLVSEQSRKWGHVIYLITGSAQGKTVNRRSIVFWKCSHHPNSPPNTFAPDDPLLANLLLDTKVVISQQEIDELISEFPGEQFYASRMDEYTKRYKKTPRTQCCREKLHGDRKVAGYEIFQNLLKNRGKHYNTTYTLLIRADEYNGKRTKYPIKCIAHETTFKYSMQDLTTITSCPCVQCRVDPHHKNVAVEIVKRRNAGRPGQIIRHAQKVKEKYNYQCAVSNSTIELQHHHVDGQDFYTETKLLWQHNGICLCGVIHRDYHNNFLSKYSVIAKEFEDYTLDSSEIQTNSSSEETTNPDLSIDGAEVSRYTFVEYLKFLIYDIQFNNSAYVNALNQALVTQNGSREASQTEVVGEITLTQVEKTLEKFCAEYKGSNWALSTREDIPFSNDSLLWKKVDAAWQ